VDGELSVPIVAAGECHPVWEVVLEVAVLLTAALHRKSGLCHNSTTVRGRYRGLPVPLI